MVARCGRNSPIILSTSSGHMKTSVSRRRGGGGAIAAAAAGCATSSRVHSGGGPTNNKSCEKPIRRKWILEKWLIWITLLVASILLDCVSADVMCYECAWQGSTPLPSTNEGVSDVCRPHNFNVNVVHKIKCANGCIKQALYEFENDPSTPPRGAVAGPNANATNTNRTRTISLDNMTFYVRGCQKDKKTRESCENKSFHNQVYALECSCFSDFCNGESSGAPSSRLFTLFSRGRNQNPLNRNFYNPGSLSLVNRNLVELSAIAVVVNFGVFKLLSVIAAPNSYPSFA